MTKIYLITNCFNNPSKIYIGKTKNNRKWNHKKRFGNQITYTIIDKINSLDSKDWKPLEQYWIEQFRQWGFDIQNKNKGGSGMNYGKISFLKLISKPVYQYKLNGDFIKKWESSKDIAKKFKCSQSLISLVCNNKQKTALGYIWKFKYIENFKPNLIHKSSKPIIKYNSKGKFIKRYNSYSELMKEEKCSSFTISNCCSGKQKYLNGFIIRKEGDEINIPQSKYNLKLS